MSCTVCGIKKAVFGVCPVCKESLCNSNAGCSCKCIECRTIQFCLSCHSKRESKFAAEYNQKGGSQYEVRGLQDILCDSCGYREDQGNAQADEEEWPSIVEDRDYEYFRCECGFETASSLNFSECGICGTNVCSDCLESEVCHL